MKNLPVFIFLVLPLFLSACDLSYSSKSQKNNVASVESTESLASGEGSNPDTPKEDSKSFERTTPKKNVTVSSPTAVITEGEAFINSLGMRFVWINPGSFMMGQGTDHDAERPIHRVTIKNGFWMSSCEMTQGQYEKLTGKNPSAVKGENLPVTKVNWADAYNLCSTFSNYEIRAKKLPRTYVYLLPSEAQWEYACRAGTTTARYGEPVDDIAWHMGNSGKKPQPVGQKKPNQWGLYDMLGNVAEWCHDGWHHGYKECPDDETPWVKDMVRGERIGRGGHFDEHAHFSSSYYRRDFGYVRHATAQRGLRFVVMKRGLRKG